jgi:hypothetical protein
MDGISLLQAKTGKLPPIEETLKGKKSTDNLTSIIS